MTVTVVLAGVDEHDLESALDAEGADVRTVDFASRPAIEEAGIVEADVFALTETEQATGIPIVKDLNADVKVVVFTGDSLPDFARGQTDLVVDPALLGPTAVAEELLNEQ
jgi:hypothetical protein